MSQPSFVFCSVSGTSFSSLHALFDAPTSREPAGANHTSTQTPHVSRIGSPASHFLNSHNSVGHIRPQHCSGVMELRSHFMHMTCRRGTTSGSCASVDTSATSSPSTCPSRPMTCHDMSWHAIATWHEAAYHQRPPGPQRCNEPMRRTWNSVATCPSHVDMDLHVLRRCGLSDHAVIEHLSMPAHGLRSHDMP